MKESMDRLSLEGHEQGEVARQIESLKAWIERKEEALEEWKLDPEAGDESGSVYQVIKLTEQIIENRKEKLKELEG